MSYIDLKGIHFDTIPANELNFSKTYTSLKCVESGIPATWVN